jgi:hypothetical protein
MSSLSDHLESSHANVVNIKKNLSNTIPSIEEQDDRYSQFITNHHHSHPSLEQQQQSLMQQHQQLEQQLLIQQQYLMSNEEEEEPRSRHSKKDKSSRSRSKKQFEEKLAKLERRSFERLDAMRVHLEGKWSQVTHEQIVRLETQHQRSLEVLQKNHSTQMASLEKKLRSEIKTCSSSAAVKRPAVSSTSPNSKRIKTRHGQQEEAEEEPTEYKVTEDTAIVEKMVKKMEETLVKDFKNLESKVQSILSHPLLSASSESSSKKGVKKKESLDVESQLQKCLLLLQTTQREVDLLQKHVSGNSAVTKTTETVVEKKQVANKRKDSSVTPATPVTKKEGDKKLTPEVTPLKQPSVKKQQPPIASKGKGGKAVATTHPEQISPIRAAKKPSIQEKKKSLVEAAASVKKTAQKRLHQTSASKARVLRRSTRTASVSGNTATTSPVTAKKDPKAVVVATEVKVGKKAEKQEVVKATVRETKPTKSEVVAKTEESVSKTSSFEVKKVTKKKTTLPETPVVLSEEVSTEREKKSPKKVVKKIGKKGVKGKIQESKAKETPEPEVIVDKVEEKTTLEPEAKKTLRTTAPLTKKTTKPETTTEKKVAAKNKKGSRLSAPALDNKQLPASTEPLKDPPHVLIPEVPEKKKVEVPVESVKEPEVKECPKPPEEPKEEVQENQVSKSQVSEVIEETVKEPEKITESRMEDLPQEEEPHKSRRAKETFKEETTTQSHVILQEMSFEAKEPKSTAFSLLSSIVAASKPSSSSIVNTSSTTATEAATHHPSSSEALIKETEEKETQSSVSSQPRLERSPSSDSSSSDILRAAMDLSGVEEDNCPTSSVLPAVASISGSNFFAPFSLPFVSIPSISTTTVYRPVSAQVAASTEVDTPTSATAPPPGTKVKVTKKKRTPSLVPVVRSTASKIPVRQTTVKTVVNGSSSTASTTTVSSESTTTEVPSPEVSSLPFRKRRTPAASEAQVIPSTSSSDDVNAVVQQVLNDINSRIEEEEQQRQGSLTTDR